MAPTGMVQRVSEPPPEPHTDIRLSFREIRVSDVISALSYALDLTEGQSMGHAVNCCLLGMRLAEVLQISPGERANLYYALLLKDIGCSSNAARMYQIFGGDELQAKREVKTTDWSRVTFDGLNYLVRNVMPGRPAFERLRTMAKIVFGHEEQSRELTRIRCHRGAEIVRTLGFSEITAAAIYCLDEHWNGKGYPDGLKGEEIPLFARILNLCQTLEVFAALGDWSEAFEVVESRRGTWFDPELVQAARPLERDQELLKGLRDGSARERVIDLEPAAAPLLANDTRLDKLCEAFAEVIDAKSPYTHEHSLGVTTVAVAMGKELGLAEGQITLLRRAALLHDIGKLSVPNSILDKPGKLSAQEWETVRLHPYYTQRILEKISGFQHLAFVASTHHERLDGTGYYRNLRASQLPMTARALAVADVCAALSAERPYRKALPPEMVLSIISKDVPHALDESCFEALNSVIKA